MKEYNRAINILKKLVTNMNTIPLDMNIYLQLKSPMFSSGSLNAKLKDDKAYEEYVEEMVKVEKGKSCSTSCCLAGYIPYIDREWYNRFESNFSTSSSALCAAIIGTLRGNTWRSINELENSTTILWDWIFNASWCNDKELAVFRLNMVINENKYYETEPEERVIINNVEDLKKLISTMEPEYISSKSDEGDE